MKMTAFWKNKRNTEGTALLPALIFGSLLFITAGTFLVVISGEYKLNDRSYRNAIAIHLAEGGVDYAIRAIQSDDIDDWAGSDPKTKTLHGVETYGGRVMGDVAISVTDPGGNNPIVEGVAYIPAIADPKSTTRTVKVKVSPGDDIPFQYMFWGRTSIYMTGNAESDSYDSRNGEYGGDNVGSNGDIATNGTAKAAIKMTGNSIVNGDATTGPGGTIKLTGNCEITGEQSDDMTAQASSVEVPSDLTDLWYWDGFGLLSLSGNETYTLEAGDYKFKRIKVTGNAVLTVGGTARLYVTGYSGESIHTSGNGQITITENAEFYVDEDMHISGNGILNEEATPPDLLVWGTDGCEDMLFSGNADLYGAFYTPNADVHFSGNADIYGAFVGREIDVNGNGMLHYDEALDAVSKPGADFKVGYWQEKE